MMNAHYTALAHRAALSAKIEIRAHDLALSMGLHIMAAQARARAWVHYDAMKAATKKAQTFCELRP